MIQFYLTDNDTSSSQFNSGQQFYKYYQWWPSELFRYSLKGLIPFMVSFCETLASRILHFSFTGLFLCHIFMFSCLHFCCCFPFGVLASCKWIPYTECFAKSHHQPLYRKRELSDSFTYNHIRTIYIIHFVHKKSSRKQLIAIKRHSHSFSKAWSTLFEPHERRLHMVTLN